MKQKYLFLLASRDSPQPVAPGAADNGCGFARGPAGWDFTLVPDSYLHDKGSRAFIGAARGVSTGPPVFPAYLLGIRLKCAGGEAGWGPRGAANLEVGSFLRNQAMGDLEYSPFSNSPALSPRNLQLLWGTQASSQTLGQEPAGPRGRGMQPAVRLNRVSLSPGRGVQGRGPKLTPLERGPNAPQLRGSRFFAGRLTLAL